MVQDLEVTNEESQLARGLGEALVIAAPRAQELGSTMEKLVRAARA
jgi:hypothetical protein